MNFPYCLVGYAVFSLAMGIASSGYSRSTGNMEDTGICAPKPYVYFNSHAGSLRIARKYLPINPVIIDAGAFHGLESCMMATIWPKGYVHCFEPVTELYNTVLSNISKYKNISAYPFALGEEKGTQIMYLSTDPSNKGPVSMSSSLSPPKEHLDYCGILFEGTQTVRVTTIDQWAAEHNIPKIDMLWLDMQGGELAALKASPTILSTVSVIVAELEFVEAYEGQPLYLEVRSWLEEQGFALVAGNFTFPKDPNQWFGDGIFVRKELVSSR